MAWLQFAETSLVWQAVKPVIVCQTLQKYKIMFICNLQLDFFYGYLQLTWLMGAEVIVALQFALLRFSQTHTLKFKSHLHKQRTLEHRNTRMDRNPLITDHKP